MLTFSPIEKFKKQWRLSRHFTLDLTLESYNYDIYRGDVSLGCLPFLVFTGDWVLKVEGLQGLQVLQGLSCDRIALMVRNYL
jgi:hypothetical protein